MNVTQTFSMALKSIAHNKMRSFLTMLGIIIGVCSVITLVSVMQGAQKKSMESYEKMGTNRIDVYYWSSSNKDLTNDIYNFCLGMKEYIAGVTPQGQTRSTVLYRGKRQDTSIYFGNEQYSLCNNSTVELGRDLCYADIKGRVRVAVIGSYVREQFFGLENPIGKKIKIRGNEYTVVGVYESKFDNQEWSQDNSILVPYSFLRNLTGSKKVDNFVVKAKNSESTQVAVDKINEFLATKLTGMYDSGSAYSDNSWMEQVQQSNNMFTWLVAGIAGISLLVGGIGIMNIMLVSVAERTREIGIRMAIGARRRDIIWQFLIEAATISACGGLIGIFFGALGSAILSSAIMKEVMFPAAPITIGAFVFSVVLGVFFGFYPANKASKLQPVEALRNQ